MKHPINSTAQCLKPALLMLAIGLLGLVFESCTRSGTDHKTKQAIGQRDQHSQPSLGNKKRDKKFGIQDIDAQITALVQYCALSTWGAVRHHTCVDTSIEKNLSYIDHHVPPEALLPRYCQLMSKAAKIVHDTPDQSQSPSRPPKEEKQTPRSERVLKPGVDSPVVMAGKNAEKRRKNSLLSYLANQIVRLSFQVPDDTSISPDTLSCMLSELKKRHNQSTDRSLSIAAVNLTATQPASSTSEKGNLDMVLSIVDSSDNSAARLAAYQALWGKGRLKVIPYIKRTVEGSSTELKDAVIYSLSQGKAWTKKEKTELCALLESFLDASDINNRNRIADADIVASATSRQLAAKCDAGFDKVLSIAKGQADTGKTDNNLVIAVSALAKRVMANTVPTVDEAQQKTFLKRASAALVSMVLNKDTASRPRIIAYKQLSEIDLLAAKKIAPKLITSSNKVLSKRASSFMTSTSGAQASDKHETNKPKVIALEPKPMP